MSGTVRPSNSSKNPSQSTSPFRVSNNDWNSPITHRVSNNNVVSSNVPVSSLSALSSKSLSSGIISGSNSGSSLGSSSSSSSGSSQVVASSQIDSKQFVTKADLKELTDNFENKIIKLFEMNKKLPEIPVEKETKEPVRERGLISELRDAIGASSVHVQGPKLSSAIRNSGPNTVNINENHLVNDNINNNNNNNDIINSGVIPNPNDYGDEEYGIDSEINNSELIDNSIVQYRNIKNNYQGSFMNWYRMNNIRDGKADREVRTICMALDSFIKEGNIPGQSQGLEILSSRLSGLIIINEGKIKNAYQVADHLEYKPIDVMVPYSNLTHAIKTSKLYEKVGGSPSGTNNWSVKKKNPNSNANFNFNSKSKLESKKHSKKGKMNNGKAGGTGNHKDNAVSSSSSS